MLRKWRTTFVKIETPMNRETLLKGLRELIREIETMPDGAFHIDEESGPFIELEYTIEDGGQEGGIHFATLLDI